MNAPKRWIVLVPTALTLLAIVPGCKTGSNRFCCKQTNCSSTCTSTACATNDGCRTSCERGLLPYLCRDKACCEKKVSCGSCCITKGVCGSACRCKPCRCNAKTTCGAIGGCSTVCAVQLGKPTYDPSSKALENPFDEMDKDKAKEKPEPMKSKQPQKTKPPAAPMPMPKEATLQNLPLPAPPIETDTAEENTNPFLRVSRTQEVPVEREIPPAPPASPQPYSKAWADALGLPSADAQAIPQYRP